MIWLMMEEYLLEMMTPCRVVQVKPEEFLS